MCILGDSPCRQNVRDFVRGNMIYKGREKVSAMNVYEVSPQHVERVEINYQMKDDSL